MRALPLVSMGRQDSGASALPGWTKVTENGRQLTSREPLELSIVCYPGSPATSIHGLTDLFTYADSYARQ
jgi:hypothetical protein